MIFVEDSEKKGIEGKYPESVEVFDSSQPGKKVKAIIVSSSADYSISGSDGIMSIPVKFVYMEVNMNLKLRFKIDEIALESEEIVLTISGFDENTPTYIDLAVGPLADITLNQDLGSTYEFHMKDSFGNNYIFQEDNIELTINFTPDGLTPLPKDFYKFKGKTNIVSSSSTLTEEYKISFSSTQVTNAPTGTAFVKVQFSQDNEWITYNSNYFMGESLSYEVYFDNPISQAYVYAVNGSPIELEYSTEVDCNTDIKVSLQLFDQWFDAPSTPIKPDLPSISLIRIPPLYAFDVENGTHPIISIAYDPLVSLTNAEGNFTFVLKVKECYVGDYIISFMFGTAFSYPFKFTTTFPIDGLTLGTAAVYNGASPYLFGIFPTTEQTVSVDSSTSQV